MEDQLTNHNSQHNYITTSTLVWSVYVLPNMDHDHIISTITNALFAVKSQLATVSPFVAASSLQLKLRLFITILLSLCPSPQPCSNSNHLQWSRIKDCKQERAHFFLSIYIAICWWSSLLILSLEYRHDIHCHYIWSNGAASSIHLVLIAAPVYLVCQALLVTCQ